MRTISMAWGAVGLLIAGCGGGGNGNVHPSNAFGCDLSLQGIHTCADYDYPDAASKSAGESACTQSGGKVMTACSTAGSVGGCKITMGAISATTWFFTGTAASAMQACTTDKGTFEAPNAQVTDGGTGDGPSQFSCNGLASTKKVDVLVMVDNSSGMQAMSDQLKADFAQFLLPLQSAGVDLHLGVVTSDYGAGATGAPGCQPSPGGQLGKLQAIGVDAPNTCQAPVGANYAQFDFAGGSSNLPNGQDLITTFTCMASVGSDGCGFEHQMESVHAALHNNLAENAGFLRSDAVLAVIYFTNEDDSSAPPTTDMFDKAAVATYGYEDSYRQTRFGVECGNPLMLPPYADSMGPLSGCVPATSPPGEEYDVSRYTDFFAKSAKSDPRRVLLAAIDAPESPFQVILSNPGTPAGTPFTPCAQLNESSQPACVPILQHSCANALNFGDPAVRLNHVVNTAPTHVIGSVCDGNYASTLQQIAQAIVAILC